MRIDDLDHLPETTPIDASSIGIVQVSTEQARGVGRLTGGAQQISGAALGETPMCHTHFPVLLIGRHPRSLLVSVNISRISVF